MKLGSFSNSKIKRICQEMHWLSLSLRGYIATVSYTHLGDKTEGAPEKYEFQAAEGVELDTEALKEFEPVARELNLTNEQAQKLVDAYPKILAGVQQRQAEAWQKTTEQWAADVKADKEIGGDKLISNLSAAQRALDVYKRQLLGCP